MHEQILVATDGSEAAESAIDAAVTLARRFGGSLHAVHVVELGDAPDSVTSEVSSELTQHGETTVDAIASRATAEDIAVTTAVIETSDSVSRALVDYAEDNGIDLIVMGTHGRTGLDRLIVGSVTERTLRLSPFPVLAVTENGHLEANVETILVPTDGSSGATVAADHAIELAEVFDAALHIVHVVDHTGLGGSGGSAMILEALEERGQQAVDTIIERAEAAGLDSIEASVLSGIPARAIVDYADDRGVDIIVMGTHGRTGLDRYLLGSVTEKVVRLADQPTLAVSSPE